MDELKIVIDLKPVSDESIKSQQFALVDLWMVRNGENQVFGPFDTASLKAYAHKYQYLFDNAQIYNLEQEKWCEMFSLPTFQRRKPKLVSAQNLIHNDEFYLLVNGQKKGPFTQAKVQKLLDSGHILPSNQISLDQGKSWIKCYEHHAFDRRTKKSNQELPFQPTEDILKKVNDKKDEIIKAKETEDAIVGLAFLGHGNDHGQTMEYSKEEYQKQVKKNEDKSETSGFSRFKVSMGASFALILVIAGIGFFTGSEDTKKDFREARTETRGINNSDRSIKRKPASVNQVKPVKRIKKKIQPKRYQPRVKPVVRPRPVIQKTHNQKRNEIFEQDIESLDINDPEVQEELTRQLAGDYELDGEEEDPNEENAEEDFNEDERVEHSRDDY